MARWSKQKADLETRLPPPTTDHGSAGPDWHSINKAETPEAKVQWTVTWDTARHADAFNTSYHKSEPEAIESARRFLRLGFVVYSIKDGSGLETMDERTIKERLAPAPLPQTAARF